MTTDAYLAPLDAVPAFETAAGVIPADGRPIYADPDALAAHAATLPKSDVRYLATATDIAAMYSSKAVSPDEVADLRRSMFKLVTDQMPEVEKVLAGTKKWDNQQTRLFGLLVERVIPKVSQTTHTFDATKGFAEMSMEELEAIALGRRKADAIDAIVRDADSADYKAERAEIRDTRREVIREIATVAAVAQVTERKLASA